MVTILQEFSFADWRGIKVSGRLDAFNDRAISAQLKSLIEAHKINGHKKIVLELSDCDFMSLQFLKLINELNKQIQSEGGEFALLNLNHQIKRQIEIFLGTRSFSIYRDLRDLNNRFYRQARSEHTAQVDLSQRFQI